MVLHIKEIMASASNGDSPAWREPDAGSVRVTPRHWPWVAVSTGDYGNHQWIEILRRVTRYRAGVPAYLQSPTPGRATPSATHAPHRAAAKKEQRRAIYGSTGGPTPVQESRFPPHAPLRLALATDRRQGTAMALTHRRGPSPACYSVMRRGLHDIRSIGKTATPLIYIAL